MRIEGLLTSWRVRCPCVRDIGEVEDLSECDRLDEKPFTSATKYMVTVNSTPDNGREAYLKGAPEVVFSFCKKMDSRWAMRRLAASGSPGQAASMDFSMDADTRKASLPHPPQFASTTIGTKLKFWLRHCVSVVSESPGGL